MHGKEVCKTLELDLVLYQLLQRNTPGGKYHLWERVFVERGKTFLSKGACFLSRVMRHLMKVLVLKIPDEIGNHC